MSMLKKIDFFDGSPIFYWDLKIKSDWSSFGSGGEYFNFQFPDSVKLLMTYKQIFKCLLIWSEYTFKA